MKNQIPNALTILRLIAIPFFIIMAFSNKPIPALFIFVLACLTDYFDGKLARKFNYITDFGKFFDPLADKLLVFSALIVLASPPMGYISWLIVIIISIREASVQGLRKFNKVKIEANIFGKIKTVLQMIGIIFSLLVYAIISLNIIPVINLNQNIIITCINVYFWIVVLFTIISAFTYLPSFKSSLFTFIICIICLNACEKEEVSTVVRQQSSEQISTRANNFVVNSRKPRAWGRPQTIYVFADDHVWQTVQPFISYSLERKFFTTENEQLFHLELQDINNLRNFNRFNNLIFISDINSDQQVSLFTKNLLGQNTTDSVIEKNASMFMNYNLWANDQLVMFFMGDSPESIRQFLFDNNDTYFRLFYDRFIARLTYNSRRIKGLDDKNFAGLPFKMFIPVTFNVFNKDIDNNFISFFWRSREDQTVNPDKFISVYWENADENKLDDNYLFNKRKELAWTYYDEDEFAEEDVMRGLKELGHREVWFLSGRWQNKKYYMGGAFQSFAFYENGKIFVIDTSVYFPAGDKLRFLLELESYAKTFNSILTDR